MLRSENGDALNMAMPATVQQVAIPIRYDYGALPADLAETARSCAQWVRDTYQALEATTLETMAEIGVRLLQAKETVGHGGFMRWVQVECGVSHSTALRMMALAETFGSDHIRHVTNLPRRLVYDVVARSTPDDIRADFKAKVEAGEAIEPEEFATRIDAAKYGVRMAKIKLRNQRGRIPSAKKKEVAAAIQEKERREYEKREAVAEQRRQIVSEFQLALAAALQSSGSLDPNSKLYQAMEAVGKGNVQNYELAHAAAECLRSLFSPESRG